MESITDWAFSWPISVGVNDKLVDVLFGGLWVEEKKMNIRW